MITPLYLNIIKSQSPETLKCCTLNIVNSKQLATNTRIGKYTFEIFMQRAREIHGIKYNYSKVTREHIKGKTSYNMCNMST